jgi:hypothetical protein
MAGEGMNVRMRATITGVLGIVGAVLAILLTVRAGDPVIFTVVISSLAILLAVVGLYSAWAMLRGKM